MNIQKVLRFVHFCESFPIKTNENVFLEKAYAFKHSNIALFLYAGIIFYADSEFRVRLPRLWLFTLPRDKVWFQPVSRKNKIFFRKWPVTWWSADYFRYVESHGRGIFIYKDESIWVSNWSVSSSDFISGHFPAYQSLLHDFSWKLGFQK